RSKMLALVERDAKPGVVSLEVPAPGEIFGPKPGLLVAARPLGLASPLPLADQNIQRLERFARRGRAVAAAIGRNGSGQSEAHRELTAGFHDATTCEEQI